MQAVSALVTLVLSHGFALPAEPPSAVLRIVSAMVALEQGVWAPSLRAEDDLSVALAWMGALESGEHLVITKWAKRVSSRGCQCGGAAVSRLRRVVKDGGKLV